MPDQKIKGLKLNGTGKQEQHAGGIKSELAILHQSTTLSKLLNGTLDVASTLPYPELCTHLLKFEKKLTLNASVRYLTLRSESALSSL